MVCPLLPVRLPRWQGTSPLPKGRRLLHVFQINRLHRRQSPPPDTQKTVLPARTAMLAALATPRSAAPCHAQKCKPAARTAPPVCRVRPGPPSMSRSALLLCPAGPAAGCLRSGGRSNVRGRANRRIGGLCFRLPIAGRACRPPEPCAAPALTPARHFNGIGAQRSAASGRWGVGATRRASGHGALAAPHLQTPCARPRRPATTMSAQHTTSQCSCPCPRMWTGCVAPACAPVLHLHPPAQLAAPAPPAAPPSHTPPPLPLCYPCRTSSQM